MATMSRGDTDRGGRLLFYGLVLLAVYLAYLVVQPFQQPLVWAGVLAMTLQPLHRRLLPRLGPAGAALTTTIVTLLLIVVPVVSLVSSLVGEWPRLTAFLQALPRETTPEKIQRLWDLARARIPIALPADPTELLTDAAQAAIGFLAPRMGGLVADIAGTVGSLFVMLFTLFFLLRDEARIADRLRRLLPFNQEEAERLIGSIHNLVIASVGAGLAVAAVQGLVGGLAFWALGVAGPAAWGVVMATCALIPVVGAALVWAPLAVWWLLSGDVIRGVILIGIGAGVIGLVDNVLRPLLLSGRTSVNGLIIFVGLLGGVSAFGFVGLVLGPIVLVTAGSLVDALTRRDGPAPAGQTPAAPVE